MTEKHEQAMADFIRQHAALNDAEHIARGQELGRILRAYYDGFVDAGFTPEEAMIFTRAFHDIMVTNSLK